MKNMTSCELNEKINLENEEEPTMAYELKKTENFMFSEFYTGYNPQTKRSVICTLDDNCVRYIVLQCEGSNTKRIARREYSNKNKALCLEKATAALNR